jgi:hypothetical protein
MLGFEPTAAQDSSPEPTLETPSSGVMDTLTLDDFSVPASGVAADAALPSLDSEGMMDLGSFGFAEPRAASTPTGSELSSGELALDAGAGPMDFELEIPEAPSAPSAAPTMDSIDTVVMDIPEIVVPAAPPLAEPTPLVVPSFQGPADADATAPTVIIGAIQTNQVSSEAPSDAAVAAPETVLPSKQVALAAAIEEVATDQRTGAVETPAVSGPTSPAPFVTETMAQLYLEQGHRADALDIYRQLVAARPDDSALRARLEAVEQATQGRPAGPDALAPESPPLVEAPPYEAPSSSKFSMGGPTIRDVLRGLFGVNNQSANGDGALPGQPGGEVGSIDILFSTEALVDAPNSLAVAFDGGYVAPAGTIDAVFAGGA